MELTGDAIADVVLKEFAKWPKKRKPRDRTEGVKEWVPLSGIVAQGKESLTCLSVASGMKCLPQSKIPQAQGVVLHDWHAEILAIRAFNRFLLDECHALLSSAKPHSEFVRLRSKHEMTETHFQPFALREGGDASMELTMAAQEDATPWDMPVASKTSMILPGDLLEIPQNPDVPYLHGRSYFSALGLVRRKPSRPDAPPTMSKSCSDKIAVKQATSLLSSITSLLLSPENCYINSLVLPLSQYSEIACKRAFSPSGRLAPLSGKDQGWACGYRFRPFNVLTTNKEFAYSRRQILVPGENLTSSNISSFSTARDSLAEALIGGTLQGRKQFALKGASACSKRSTWALALQIATLISVPAIEHCLRLETYGSVKESLLLQGRNDVKTEVRKVLCGWARNTGGEAFALDTKNAGVKVTTPSETYLVRAVDG